MDETVSFFQLTECNTNIKKDPLDEKEEEPPSDVVPSLAGYIKPEKSMAKFSRSSAILPFVVKRKARTSCRTKRFRRKFFPQISDLQWNNWHWQISNRVRTLAQLERYVILSDDEKGAIDPSIAKLPLAITPYYMSLIDAKDSSHPLRRSVIPSIQELIRTSDEADDPLAEEAQSPIPGLVHRYPDRVLLLALDFCSTYCRYCTRSRVVGHDAIYPTRSRLEKAFDYIRANSQIRDVLVSGGDPMTLSDDRLSWVLANLRQIPHVEIIRIGTKIPAVLPQRITPQLVRMLRKYHPLWMSLHFTHPDECTPEAYKACAMLADAGIPLGSQTVLLSDVNDRVETMALLFHHMLKMRVRPYYLYQCDPISGSSHFRTPVEKGLEIIQGLRGYTSGYAIPTYVIDAPGGGGKIPLMPDYVLGRGGKDWTLCNYLGKPFHYPSPKTESIDGGISVSS